MKHFSTIVNTFFLLPSPGRLSLLCRKLVRLIGEANYSKAAHGRQALFQQFGNRHAHLGRTGAAAHVRRTWPMLEHLFDGAHNRIMRGRVAGVQGGEQDGHDGCDSGKTAILRCARRFIGIKLA